MRNTLLVFIIVIFSFAVNAIMAQNCNASFTFDGTDISIQFTDQSTSTPGDPIISWFWDFDDGSTSNQQNPFHTFPEDDKYRVILSITTQNGCNSSIEIEIEICVLNVNYSVGNCNASGMVQLNINVSDIYDNAKDIDISVDGQLIPGSPFEIEIDEPVFTTFNMPGDGLQHTLTVQSTDIGTCNEVINFSVPDCNSNCFLSSLSIGVSGGTTHNVDVGDNFFSPVNTTITLGDVVHFQWVGDGHSTTSDATSGPDSWNSGEIGFGATYDVTIQTPGVHPYYCIPHGGPGGAGMSGSIVANCPASNQFTLNISFNTTQANPAGYNILLDGVAQAGSPFSYNGTGPQSASLNLNGDGQTHSIEIVDVNDPSCVLSTNWVAPDCGAAPSCSLSLTASQTGGCDAANQVSVEVTVNSINGGASGFNISVDGATAPGSPFAYDPSGVTTVSVNVPGDGVAHTIVATDVADPACSGTTNVTTADCTIQCAFSNVTASSGTSITHNVAVQDFDFFPQHITITAGDIVEWSWTGAVDHTSTSDATAGPDAWDSGLFGTGATFQSPVLSTGVHPYYCIPHGAPGGVGMAGTITVQANCTNGNVSVAVSFTETGGGFSGFQILVDGNNMGSFLYDASGNNTVSVNVPGDGLSHSIMIQDIDDPTCTGTTSITTPDCNASTCQMTITAQENGPCSGADEVPVQVTVNDIGGGASGFTLTVDGANPTNFNYSGSGTTTVSINVPGDGQNHSIEVIDVDQPDCSATTALTTTNCVIPCSITNLSASSGVSTTHVVEVRDFDFFPQHITITAGDIVEWQWTGAIDHTSTSDATAGPDAWDSGLLGTGATFQSPALATGVHPYYCIPHGAPGGVGMAGTITVQANCTNGMVPVLLTFSAQGGSFSGFSVSVDGTNAGNFNYDPSGNNTITVNVPGDGQSHSILVTDADDAACVAATSITTPDCNASTCQMTITAQENGPCSGADEVPVQVTVNDVGGGASGFTLTVDGANPTSFNYSGSGTTTVSINVPGDGQNHSIEVIDVDQPDCSATTALTTTNCVIPCQLSDLILEVATGTTHIVEVRDFNFEPMHLDVGVGDIIRWEWTGAIPHTSTSDATAGPDAWDSGLLSQGAVFEKTIETEGNHPYYCIPHGSPGGIGMAGTITAGSPIPACDNGQVAIQIQFTATNPGANGFEVLIDGNSIGSFPYQTGGNNQVVISIDGDGQSHTFEVRDIDSAVCSISDVLVVPKCNTNQACSLSLDVQQLSNCNSDNELEFEITVTAINPGQNGFNILIDGIIQNESPFDYAPMGSTVVTLPVNGTGSERLFEIQDVDSIQCTASTLVNVPLCGPICEILNLHVETGPKRHLVEVRDFEFAPKVLDIVVGDTVEFIWTGVIPHTTTSDALSGPNTWDSGLLSQGESYQVVISEVGAHPYYCIPHGGPGGIGMAGTINVLEQCENGLAQVNVSFSTTNGSNDGYNIFLDGQLIAGPISYTDPVGLNQAMVSIPGDAALHTLTVQDLAVGFCAASTNFLAPNCTSDCQLSDLTINIGAPVIHIVEVLDFEFVPRDITVNVGDIIRFDWIGSIPHTATSDATSGEDVWNSGLLGQGAVYEVTIQNAGIHPYYCIPHGAPGGIGMAGTITVMDVCEDGQLPVSFSFQAENTSSETYQLYLDGTLAPDSPFSYNNNGENTVTFDVPADGQVHELYIEDSSFPNCILDSLFQMPDCDDPCWDFNAKFELEIDHSTNTVTAVSTTTDANTWIWDWGDSSNSSGDSVMHSYNSAGNYTVCLAASNELCMDTICQEISIEDIFCEANFNVEYDGLTVHLFDQSSSSDSIINWSWSMDSLATMTDINPVYTFEDLGIYTICLTIESETCTSDTCITIDLSNPCILFDADFEYSIDEENLHLQFTDLTTGSPYTWLWGFGDGNTSNEQHPEHYYNLPGTYTICLLVQDSIAGCNASYCTQIAVGVPNDIPIISRNHQVKIFPNPASSQQQVWTVEGIVKEDYFRPLDFKLYNMHGQTVMEVRLQGNEQTIFSVGQPLSSGAYFLELRSENMTYRGKLMVQ